MGVPYRRYQYPLGGSEVCEIFLPRHVGEHEAKDLIAWLQLTIRSIARGEGVDVTADAAEIARLTAEGERLRAALYEFATQHKCGCGRPHCNNCERDRMAEAAMAQGE